MQFYSTFDVYSIPKKRIPMVRQVGAQQIVENVSPGEIVFRGGVCSTNDPDEIAQIRESKKFGVYIFETPEPVQSAKKEQSKITGTLTQPDVLTNNPKLPINQIPQEPAPANPGQTPSESSTSQEGKKTLIVEVKTRNDAVAYLVTQLKVDPEKLKGLRLPEICKLAKDVHGVEFAGLPNN